MEEVALIVFKENDRKCCVYEIQNDTGEIARKTEVEKKTGRLAEKAEINVEIN